MNNNSDAAGMSLTGVLTVVFIVLKLTGNIDWSWLWVLSPLWIGFAIVFVLVVLIGLIGTVRK